MRTARWLLVALVATAIALAPACGGGGGGGGSPTAPPPPPPPPPPAAGVEFTPAGEPGVKSIHLVDTEDADASIFRVEIRVEDIEDLYGLGFDLDFPQLLLAWDSDETVEGDFLSSDGTATDLLIRERPGGNLIVGLSRLGEVDGVSGSGLLLSLQFTTRDNGSGALHFTNNETLDPLGKSHPDTEWLAGDVTVRVP